MYLKIFIIVLGVFVSCAEPKGKSETNIEETQTTMVTSEKKDSIPAYIDKDFVMGKFDPKRHAAFARIDGKYADTDNRYMHKEAYEAFKQMHEAAKADGITLVIKSAARNFDYQKSIWERKWTGRTLLEDKINAERDIPNAKDRVLAIMKYSSMPGTSRHHWGTDIDLNSFTNRYFEQGKGKAVYDWLIAHAHDYGFYQSYTSKDVGRTGYEEEKWHWSYLPIAAYCLERMESDMTNKEIKGFDGSKEAEGIDVKQNYIFGIDKKCLEYGTH